MLKIKHPKCMISLVIVDEEPPARKWKNGRPQPEVTRRRGEAGRIEDVCEAIRSPTDLYALSTYRVASQAVCRAPVRLQLGSDQMDNLLKDHS